MRSTARNLHGFWARLCRILFLCAWLPGQTGCLPQSPDYAPVLAQLRNATDLVSVEFTLAKLIVAGRQLESHRNGPIHRPALVAHTQATVRTGVDLNKLQPGAIAVEGRAIALVLPAVEVLEFAYPIASCRVLPHYSHPNALHPAQADRVLEQAQQQLDAYLPHLPFWAITERAVANTLTRLLQEAGYTSVRIRFQTGTTQADASTITPKKPAA